MKRSFHLPRRRRTSSRLSLTRKLACEPLEDRRMLSVLFVDDDAGSGGDGLTWSSAYGDLQDALSQAAVLKADGDPGNDVDQIWIAEGVYRPSVESEPGIVRSATFSLVDGVTLYGGFAGDEAAIDERDVFEHVTTLSGDIGICGDAADNAYTVVYCGEDVTATLEGVTITGGNANEDDDSNWPERTNGGGGVFNDGTLSVLNCTVSANAAIHGGGIYNRGGTLTIAGSTLSDNFTERYGAGGGIRNSSGTLTMEACIVSGNSAGSGGGVQSCQGTLTVADCLFSDNKTRSNYGDGGAIYTSYGTGTVTGSTFLNNRANGEGGAIHNDYEGLLRIENSTFRGNSAGSDGGAIRNYYDLAVANSVFSGNSAGDEGGGIHSSLMLSVVNSTLSHNDADDGGGIYNCGELDLVNSILWKNGGGEFRNWDDFSASANLIGVDPGFLRDPSDGGDGWGDDPSTLDVDESANDDYGDLRLTPRSAAVDFGNDAAAVDADGNPLETDLDGNDRVYGDSIDCGAFELQEAAAVGRETPSLMVTTTDDAFDLYDGRVSLREAIFYAGVASPDTTITFDEALDGATIPLDGTSLWIDKTLSIDASSLESLTIDADKRSRVFDVVAGNGGEVTLNALTITGGFTTEDGGGVYNHQSTLSIVNCTISGNSAAADGGGISNAPRTETLVIRQIVEISPIPIGSIMGGFGTIPVNLGNLPVEVAVFGKLAVINCTISGNSAINGGGIRNEGEMSVAGSTFSDNSATNTGGGISNGIEAAMTVTNSTLQGNAITTNAFSRRCGGGISNDGTLKMNNCSVVGNLARYGGGISNAGLLTVTNSTIAGNSATSGGGIYNSKAGISAIYGGGVHGALASALASVGGIPSTAKLTLHNSILWQNSAGDLFHAGSGVFSDSHNLIGIDPLFVRDPANDDYGDLRLRAGSPAIDQGDSGLVPEDTLDLDRDGNAAEPVPLDLGGNARVVGGAVAVDMGAYEYFALWGIPGDLNNDYSVNSSDLDIIRANWGRTVTPGSLPGGDPSGDGLVNLVDLNLVRANWDTTPPMAAGVREATGASVHSKAVSGPRTASDATDTALRNWALRNWDQAELAWAKEVESLANRQRRDVKTATRAAAVDLVLFGWE